MVLADLRPSQEAQEAERAALVATLRRLEGEQARLIAAVAEGAGEAPALVAAIREREQRRAEVQRRIDVLEQRVEPLDLRRAERQVWERVRAWRAVLARQSAQARGVLQQLLDGQRIVFTPREDPGRRWYDFAGQAGLGGLLAGEVSQAGVTPAGFEPAISTLKGSRPWPG